MDASLKSSDEEAVSTLNPVNDPDTVGDHQVFDLESQFAVGIV